MTGHPPMIKKHNLSVTSCQKICSRRQRRHEGGRDEQWAAGHLAPENGTIRRGGYDLYPGFLPAAGSLGSPTHLSAHFWYLWSTSWMADHFSSPPPLHIP
jgi:hypothetical protein